MDYTERERLINQIASRHLYFQIGSREYVLKAPSASIRHKADLVYQKAIDDNKFEDFVRFPVQYLVHQSVIVPNYEESIASLTKNLKDLQVELFKSLINPATQKDIRKRLSMVKEKLNATLSKKHMLDDVTLEGYANLIRLQYLIFKITYYNGRRLWVNQCDIDYKIMEKLIYLYSASRIEIPKLREIARTEPWNTIYNAGKPNPFGKAIDLTENQRDLLYYTVMYENASQATEPPSEEVIKDDDMFDGWMIETIKRIKEQKKENTVKQSVGRKYKDAQELFIPIKPTDETGRVKTEEEIQQELNEINGLNDLSVTMLKKQRAAAIKARGEISEAQLPDKQMELQNMMRDNALKMRK